MGGLDVVAGNRKRGRVAVAPPFITAVSADGIAAYFPEHLRVRVVVRQESEMAEHGQLVIRMPVNLLVRGQTVEREIGGREIVVARRRGAGAAQKAPGCLL